MNAIELTVLDLEVARHKRQLAQHAAELRALHTMRWDAIQREAPRCFTLPVGPSRVRVTVFGGGGPSYAGLYEVAR